MGPLLTGSSWAFVNMRCPTTFGCFLFINGIQDSVLPYKDLQKPFVDQQTPDSSFKAADPSQNGNDCNIQGP